ncbi:MAG: HEAT repeat domain-containing protein [Armatimonadota bacterium]
MKRIVSVAICLVIIAGLCSVCISASPAEQINDDDPEVRRMAALKLASTDASAIPLLKDTLMDSDPLVRRAAARALASFKETAIPALASALQSEDAVLKRNVLMFLADIGPAATDAIQGALDDENELVRERAVTALATIRPMSQAVLDALLLATDDESSLVSSRAVTVLMSYMKLVYEEPLPAEGWKFRTDPQDVGRDEEWYAVDLHESAWKDIGIEKFWQNFGFDYEGVGWYRRTITLPDDPGGDRTVMHFEAVDESTWLWVNGEFAGVHDIGPQGWTKPFQIDVSRLVKWGHDNQLTVRVLNTAQAGGIYQPVTIRSYATQPLAGP